MSCSIAPGRDIFVFLMLLMNCIITHSNCACEFWHIISCGMQYVGGAENILQMNMSQVSVRKKNGKVVAVRVTLFL